MKITNRGILVTKYKIVPFTALVQSEQPPEEDILHAASSAGNGMQALI